MQHRQPLGGPSRRRSRLLTNSTMNLGVTVAAGGGSSTSAGDHALKENFAAVDGQALLDRLAETPVTWNYKSQDPSVRHIGPMAQDFYAAFGVGEDDTHITTIDPDGVALAAVQGLYEMVLELKAENARLEARLATLEGRATSEVGTWGGRRSARAKALAALGRADPARDGGRWGGRRPGAGCRRTRCT